MNKPIGIFDSGFGGLTVTRKILNLMPNEDIVFFGDTAHLPYGTKSKKVITSFSRDIIEFLVRQNVKLIVIACNTASAYSLATLKKEFDLPVIGVIQPGALSAVKSTKNYRIGVIGTEATIGSEAYEKAINKIDHKIKVFSQPCPLFVPLVEEGWAKHPVTRQVAEYYLKPFIRQRIDTLILGCTHYPLIKSLISDILEREVILIDSSIEVAKSVKSTLESNGIYNKDKFRRKNRKVRFFVSDNPEKFSRLGRMFLLESSRIKNVKYIDIDE